jgi:TonB family protein
VDNMTKPGLTVGTAEGNSGPNTRSNPVCLEVAITIRSLPGEKDEPSSGQATPTREEARTVIVFDNGAVLRLAGNFPPGQAVILSNHEGRDVVCRVVSTHHLPTVKGYIEVEFLEPVADFWGIHRPAEQANISTPAVDALPPPPAAPQPQISPGDVPSVPPAPPIIAPAMAEIAAPPGHAPSFEDIAGVLPSSPLHGAQAKPPVSAPRIPASSIATEPSPKVSEAARPFTPPSMPSPAQELAPLSAAWEAPLAAPRETSSSNEILGKFSSSYTILPDPSTEPRSKTPLILGGTAIVLIALGAGVFFTRQGRTTTSPPSPVAAASQPTPPAPREPTSVPTHPKADPPAAEPAPTSSSHVPPASLAPAEVVPTSASSEPQTDRRQANIPDGKQIEHVDAKQPDRSPQRQQLARELKMGTPTVESRAGRLVDGFVPNVSDITTTSAVIGTPGGDLVSTVSHPDNPPAPPVGNVSSGAPAMGLVEPRLISSTRPVYPMLAKQSSTEGDVVVSAEIDWTGKVVGAKATSGPISLRQAGVDAVKNWKYAPATIDGRPTPAQIVVKIQFRLKTP